MTETFELYESHTQLPTSPLIISIGPKTLKDKSHVSYKLSAQFNKNLCWMHSPKNSHEHFFCVSLQAVLDRMRSKSLVIELYDECFISNEITFLKEFKRYYFADDFDIKLIGSINGN